MRREEDPRDYKVSFDKIRATLGFETLMTVPDGIGEIAGALDAERARRSVRRSLPQLNGDRHRVLLVNQYAGSPSLGMEFRPSSLAREWARTGHETLIVAGAPSHVRAHDPELRSKVTLARVDGVDFEWYRLPSYDGNGVRRAANIVTFATLLRARSGALAREFRPDIVVASRRTHWTSTVRARSRGAPARDSSSRCTTSGR